MDLELQNLLKAATNHLDESDRHRAIALESMSKSDAIAADMEVLYAGNCIRRFFELANARAQA